MSRPETGNTKVSVPLRDEPALTFILASTDDMLRLKTEFDKALAALNTATPVAIPAAVESAPVKISKPLVTKQQMAQIVRPFDCPRQEHGTGLGGRNPVCVCVCVCRLWRLSGEQNRAMPKSTR